MTTTAEAVAILRQARDAFKAAGKRSLVLGCEDLIEDAVEEIRCEKATLARAERIAKLESEGMDFLQAVSAVWSEGDTKRNQ